MALTLKVQVATIISESKKLKVQVAACTFNRRHNWNQVVGRNTLIQPKYLARKSMYSINKPGQKWLNQPPINLSGLTTLIQTYSLALVWINQRAGKNWLKISRIVHQCLVKKDTQRLNSVAEFSFFSLIQPQSSHNLEANPIIWLHQTTRTYWH